MRHEIFRQGFAFALRPVRLEDAATIVELRTDPRYNAFLNTTSPLVADQERWLQNYFAKEGEWYFAIERTSSAGIEGLICIYDFDATLNTSEWGRWIVRRDSLAALESVILIHDVAFEDLGIGSLRSRTIIENRSVVAFHESFGAQPVGIIKAGANIAGVKYDMIDHEITREHWPEKSERLRTLARRTSELLRLSEG